MFGLPVACTHCVLDGQLVVYRRSVSVRAEARATGREMGWGTGNNYGSLIGGFLVWFLWVEAEPLGLYLVELFTSPLSDTNPLRIQLITNAAHMRYIMMGLLLLLVLRFAPKGIFPEGR